MKFKVNLVDVNQDHDNNLKHKYITN